MKRIQSFQSWDEEEEKKKEEERKTDRPMSFEEWQKKNSGTATSTPTSTPTQTSTPTPSSTTTRTTETATNRPVSFEQWDKQRRGEAEEEPERQYSSMDRYRPSGVYTPEQTEERKFSQNERYRPSGVVLGSPNVLEEPKPWDYLYTSGTIQRGKELAAKSTLTSEEKKEARSIWKEIDKALMMPGIQDSNKFGELAGLNSKLLVKSNRLAGVGSGIIHSLGLDWLSDRATDIIDAMVGIEYKPGIEPTKAKEYTSLAKANQPIAYAAGEVAGNLMELSAISGAVGKALQGAKWFTKLAPWVQKAASSAITFGISGAASGIANTETKEEWDERERQQQLLAEDFGASYTPREYSIGQQLGKVGISAATGATAGFAGGALSEGISQLGGAYLTSHNLTQNKLARAVFAGLSGAGFASGNTAVRELERYLEYPEGYHPDAKQIAEDLIVAFAFSSLTYLISAGPGAQQASPATKYSSEYFNENMSREEASRIYRELAKQYHPDLHPGDPLAEATMKRINADYELLQTIMAPVWAKDSITNAEKSYRTATTTSGNAANAAAEQYASEIKYLQGTLMNGAIHRKGNTGGNNQWSSQDSEIQCAGTRRQFERCRPTSLARNTSSRI